MKGSNVLLINSKSILEYLETIDRDVQFTKQREVYSGRTLLTKQIKDEHYD